MLSLSMLACCSGAPGIAHTCRAGPAPPPPPLQDGKDLHQLGLSNAKSTPADWMRRAQTMVGGGQRPSRAC